ncbi:hypothetical protein [Ochrobactrum sp. BTU1]|uniref:hypothetical protein n=1 Tax=Ochrobactrum sp. BTU1 TaxID=2840456 RepID=UPI001C057FA0|nr:hypothetical protein KMS41_14150 [Ochrobactrum sp. BTU1]
MYRYQTLIGSLFVLVPVAFAIEQLKETRRQHEQSARLPFLSELSAMNHAQAIALRYVESGWATKILQSYMGKQPEPTQAEIDALALALDPTSAYALRLLGDAIAGKTIPKPTGGTFVNIAQSLAASFGPLETPEDANKRFAAEKLKNAIDARRSFLRLFITGI